LHAEIIEGNVGHKWSNQSAVTHILVVEDEPNLRKLLVGNLSFEGYTVEAVEDGEPALKAHQLRRADLIVLDLMLPKLDGFEVLRTLRSTGDEVPVLMLTARGSESDRVKGLSLGADDYLVKPFSILEFVARIKAILRRTHIQEKHHAIRTGAFHIDFAAMKASKDGAPIDLTARELRLLEILVAHPGRTHSRNELLQMAWEAGARPTPRTVDVHIANLRRKLGDDDKRGLITTVEGEGYRWTLPVEQNPT
jgi:DNA-binding response OmpR family regulator